MNFPTEEPLLLPENLLTDKSSAVKYKLEALICHSGTVLSGHYTAYAKHDDHWLYFDDSQVLCESPANDDNRAYILFYTRFQSSDCELRGDD